MKPKLRNPYTIHLTARLADGREVDDVVATFQASLAEPDVGWGGGVDIIKVEADGEDITGFVASLDELADEAQAWLDDHLDPNNEY